MRHFPLLSAVWLAAATPILAQSPALGAARQFRVALTATQIVVSQGQDETLQRVVVDIWGRLREPGTLRTASVQLDGDPELEFLVVSRNDGTGPYYRLQLVASRPAGILVWSYPSCGAPRIEAPRVALGQCPGGAGAAGTAVPRYRWYRFTDQGLIPQ
jgi:hypothetical protein